MRESTDDQRRGGGSDRIGARDVAKRSEQDKMPDGPSGNVPRATTAGGTAGTSGSNPSGESPWHWQTFTAASHSTATVRSVVAGVGVSSARHFEHAGLGLAGGGLVQHPPEPQLHSCALPVTGHPHVRAAGFFPRVTTEPPNAAAHCASTSNAASTGCPTRRSRRKTRDI